MVDRTRNQVAAVDREKTCPFLLRVFVKPGAHHEVDRDFQVPDRLPLPDESQLYAWKDSTLRDICLQLIETSPSIKLTSTAKFSIRLVFLDAPRDLSSAAPAHHHSADGPMARYKSQDLGTVFARDLARESASGPPPGAGARTLQELRFMVGDFLDVALLPAHPAPSPIFSPVDGRPSFGIRGAAAASGRLGSQSSLEGPRWGRPAASSSWGSASVAPRWANASDRRGSHADAGRDRGGPLSAGPDARRWGHNPASGRDDRESRRPSNGHGRRRPDSRSRSPSLSKRGGRDSPRGGGR